jgi:hypothetical protein
MGASAVIDSRCQSESFAPSRHDANRRHIGQNDVIAVTRRPPRFPGSIERESALGYEIAQEQAAALGRLGRALETALAALSRHDRTDAENDNSTTRPSPAGALRERLVQEAGDALWCFIVQREACGLRDQRSVMRQYSVPAEVRNRMGVFGATARRRSG